MKTSNHLRIGLSGRNVSGIIGGLTALLLSVFFMTGCPQVTNDPTPSFIAVTSIINVPGSVEAGVEFNLSGAAVLPENATNKTITWSLSDAGGTGVTSVAGGKATPTAAGHLKIQAAIANGRTAGSSSQTGLSFVLDFTIEVKPAFVKVSSIIGVPDKVVMGREINLNNTVVAPFNANYKTIQWSISDAGTTGAGALADNKTTPVAKGELKITAVIENGSGEGFNYTANFTITVITPEEFNAVTDISGVPAEAEAGIVIDLSGAVVAPANADNKTIVWSVVESGGTGVNVFSDSKATPSAAGTLKIRASIENGKVDGTAFVKDFEIAVKPAFVAVNGIGGVEATVGTGALIDLTTAAALPENATNKAIAWSLVDAGTTGVTEADLADDYKITPTATGILKLKASVANGSADRKTAFVKEIEIEVVAVIVPVTGLSGTVPAAGKVNTEINLSGIKAAPANATYQNIVWNVTDPGTTGVTEFVNSKATPSAAGTMKIQATVTNGTGPSIDYVSGEYTITVTIVEVTGITGVPETGLVNTERSLSGQVMPVNATYNKIVWTVTDGGTTGVPTGPVEENKVTPTGTGTLKVQGTVAKGKDGTADYVSQEFPINIVTEFIPVWRIIGDVLNIPEHHATREIDLTGAKARSTSGGGVEDNRTPTNTAIVWTLMDHGNTKVTEADLEDGKITPQAAGTLKIRATVAKGKTNGTEDFTQDVSLKIIFKAVTSITLPEMKWPNEEIDLNTAAVIIPGSGQRSSQSPVVWTVREAMSGVPAGVVTNGKVTPTDEGKLKLKAEIANGSGWGIPFVKDDLEISIKEESPVLLFKVVGSSEVPEGDSIDDLDTAFNYINSYSAAGDKYVVELKAPQFIKPYVSPDGEGKKDIEITLRGQGAQTIKWNNEDKNDDAWGLFTLRNNATLILDNNITVDGGKKEAIYSDDSSRNVAGVYRLINISAGHLLMKAGSLVTNVAGMDAVGPQRSGSTPTGSIKLEGGSISDNAATGVFVKDGVTFSMSSGSISNNGSYGLELISNATVTMSGGEISGNIKNAVYSNGTTCSFTMTGGSIINNEQGIRSGGFFYMTGGTIGNNGTTSTYKGFFMSLNAKLVIDKKVDISDEIIIQGSTTANGVIFLGPDFDSVSIITISVTTNGASGFPNTWKNAARVILKGGTPDAETVISETDFDNWKDTKFQMGTGYIHTSIWDYDHSYAKTGGSGHVNITYNAGYGAAQWVAD
jgi:hypothetical protein